MVLSTPVWNLLFDLGVDGSKNARPLAVRLGSRRALEDLVATGHLEWQGGRVVRTQTSVDAFALYEKLPGDGSTIGNGAAKKHSGLTQFQYDAAKLLLLKTGEVTRGRGQGGSIRRSTDIDLSGPVGDVHRESELYEPFKTWLEDETPPLEGAVYTFTQITANGKSQRRATGQWSKPDVVRITVTDHKMLPTEDVVVSTYELKPYKHARNLVGVFEASAHQRRAHNASLVVEWPPADWVSPPPGVVEECSRLGVGLYLIWDREAEQVLEPQTQSPPIAGLAEFIEDLLPSKEVANYLEAIGRPPAIDTLPEDTAD